MKISCNNDFLSRLPRIWISQNLSFAYTPLRRTWLAIFTRTLVQKGQIITIPGHRFIAKICNTKVLYRKACGYSIFVSREATWYGQLHDDVRAISRIYSQLNRLFLAPRLPNNSTINLRVLFLCPYPLFLNTSSLFELTFTFAFVRFGRRWQRWCWC